MGKMCDELERKRGKNREERGKGKNRASSGGRRVYVGRLRESWTRGCPDSRTIIVRRTPRLRRYKIEDSIPCLDGTFLGVEGKLGNTILRSPPIVTDSV